MSDLVFLPAHQLAQLIRERQVSAVEVLNAHLKQIAKHNNKINAFITLDEKAAQHHAKRAWFLRILWCRSLKPASQQSSVDIEFMKP